MWYDIQNDMRGWFQTPGGNAIWMKGLGFKGYIDANKYDWLSICRTIPAGSLVTGFRGEGIGACGKYCNRHSWQVLAGPDSRHLSVVWSQVIYSPGTRWGLTHWGVSIPGPAVIAFQANGRAYVGSVSPMIQTPDCFTNVFLFGDGY